MNQWNPWSLVPIAISILLGSALIGWILRLLQERHTRARSNWKTITKIAITTICGAGMACVGCFSLISPINRGNDYESLFLAVAFGGLAFFIGGIIWGTVLGIGYLVLAFKRDTNGAERNG
jgi:hypothetical protein